MFLCYQGCTTISSWVLISDRDKHSSNLDPLSILPEGFRQWQLCHYTSPYIQTSESSRLKKIISEFRKQWYQLLLSSLKFLDALNSIFPTISLKKNYFAPMSVFVPCKQHSGGHLSRPLHYLHRRCVGSPQAALFKYTDLWSPNNVINHMNSTHSRSSIFSIFYLYWFEKFINQIILISKYVLFIN